jgi:hypothetical protein
VRLLFRGFAGLLELPDAGVEHADEVAHRRRKDADHLERAGENADELGAQDIRRRQLGELLDLITADRRAVEDASPDDEHTAGARDIAERLRDGDGIAVRLEEGDRRGTVEQGQERIRTGSLGGTPGERVLDDTEACAVLKQLRAELVDLRHGEAAVVRDEQVVRVPQPIRQLRDHPFLL